ncbi:acyl-coenzyme A thioesterase 2, mitochondrial-like isoform X2 [Ciona intestinalis]
MLRKLYTIKLSNIRLFCCSTICRSATINVTPNPSISDEKIKISIQGLTPSEDVTLHASTRMTKKCFYESFAQYKVPSSGIVDLTKDASVAGMYTGVEPMGLIWSMEGRADREEDIVRLIHRDVTTPQEVCLRVYGGPLNRLREKQDKVIAETTVERLFMAPGVKRMDVRDNGLVATLFIPPGDGPFPDDAQGFLPFHTRKNVSYLLIGGMNDKCIPNEMCLNEAQRLLAEENHPDYEITRYSKVGHLFEPPYAVHSPYTYQQGFPFNTFLNWGGEKVNHCKAQEDSWPKQLHFLKTRLS